VCHHPAGTMTPEGNSSRVSRHVIVSRTRRRNGASHLVTCAAGHTVITDRPRQRCHESGRARAGHVTTSIPGKVARMRSTA
jgi:hypothetical protein